MADALQPDQACQLFRYAIPFCFFRKDFRDLLIQQIDDFFKPEHRFPFESLLSSCRVVDPVNGFGKRPPARLECRANCRAPFT